MATTPSIGAVVKCPAAGPWKPNLTFDGSNSAAPVTSTVTVEPANAKAPFDVIANVYLLLGDTDRGFEWMERAVSKHASYVRWMNVHPAFDPWRNDPRFVALVQKLRLPAARS